MELKLGPLRQVALPSRNLQRSIAFYRDTLGLNLIAQFPPSLAFFQLGAIRLLIERSEDATPGGVLYFEVESAEAAQSELEARGVQFDSKPHLIHRDNEGTFGPAGEEEWMTFFRDPEGNLLALAERRARS